MAAHRKLGRKHGHRELMLRNLTSELIKNGKIQTTEARAKELRKTAEKMITLAKRGDLHARRQAAQYLTTPEIVQQLFEIAPKYAQFNGGYTRIYKLGPRRGDASMMVQIELI